MGFLVEFLGGFRMADVFLTQEVHPFGANFASTGVASLGILNANMDHPFETSQFGLVDWSFRIYIPERSKGCQLDPKGW